MTSTIIIQGIELNDFLNKVEQAAYKGQKLALSESKDMSFGIDWSKYKDFIGVDELTDIFPIQRSTARKWITEKKLFGDYQTNGKNLFVSKESVKKHLSKITVSQKR